MSSNRKIIEYKTIGTDTESVLDEEVNTLLSNGWSLRGPLKITRLAKFGPHTSCPRDDEIVFHQVLVRFEPVTLPGGELPPL
jgi:hypothetical protein